MLSLRVLAATCEVAKTGAASVVLASIRYEGLHHHISFHLLHDSLVVKIVFGGLWLGLQLVGLAVASFPPVSSFVVWRSVLIFRLTVGLLYGDIVWAFLAWIKYFKVNRTIDGWSKSW